MSADITEQGPQSRGPGSCLAFPAGVRAVRSNPEVAVRVPRAVNFLDSQRPENWRLRLAPQIDFLQKRAMVVLSAYERTRSGEGPLNWRRSPRKRPPPKCGDIQAARFSRTESGSLRGACFHLGRYIET